MHKHRRTSVALWRWLLFVVCPVAVCIAFPTSDKKTKTALHMHKNPPPIISTLQNENRRCRLRITQRMVSPESLEDEVIIDDASSTNDFIDGDKNKNINLQPSLTDNSERTLGILVLLTVPLAWGTYAPVVKYMYEKIDPAMPGMFLPSIVILSQLITNPRTYQILSSPLSHHRICLFGRILCGCGCIIGYIILLS